MGDPVGKRSKSSAASPLAFLGAVFLGQRTGKPEVTPEAEALPRWVSRSRGRPSICRTQVRAQREADVSSTARRGCAVSLLVSLDGERRKGRLWAWAFRVGLQGRGGITDAW